MTPTGTARPREPRSGLRAAAATKLAAIGAELLICPDHTIHPAIDSELYPHALAVRGLDCVRPTAAERHEVHRIIMDELVHGRLRPEATAAVRRVVERLTTDGCDAVVLGCTELPLILDDASSPLPRLDSTRLLARAALEAAASA